jgi:predicted Zn-dependent protease
LSMLYEASAASHVSAAVYQQENSSFSSNKYHSSIRPNIDVESVTESLQRYLRQTPEALDGDLKTIIIVDYAGPSPLSGLKLPFSASSIDPCGDGTDEFELLGGIRWQSFPVTYAINTANSGVDPTIARNAVIESFDEFDTYMPGQAFTLTNDFNAAKIKLSWQFIDGPSNVLGQATWTYDPATLEIVSASIVLDSGDNWFASAVHSCAGTGTSHDIQNIATHELGHAVGLGHVSDAFLTMYPTSSAGETLKRSLGDGDKAGLNFLYPGSDWSQWQSLAGSLRDNSNPVAIENSDGRLEAFVIGTNNELFHKWQISQGSSTWSAYESLGGGIKSNTSPAVARNSDGRLEVFVVGSSTSSLFHKWQLSS